MTACPTASPRRARRGFTLIELLVVVAILALLISILLPSLARARSQAKQAVCMANMRSIGHAFTMYSQEFKGVWPAAVDSMGNQNRWPVPFHQAGIITAELEQYDANGDLLRAGGKSVFLCPAEAAPRAIRNWRVPGNTVDRVEIGGSYAYSGEIHRDGDSLRLGNTTTPPFLKPVDRCRRPGEVITLVENYRPIELVSDPGWRYYRDDYFFGYRTLQGTAVPVSNAAERLRIMGGRHMGSMNVLMIDTHVVSAKPERLTYNDMSWDRWNQWPQLPPGGQ